MKHRERFSDKTVPEPNSGCWLWTGAMEGGGYGQIKWPTGKDRLEMAHRVSWQIHRGSIPAGAWVLHKCDNRICVNPAHLFLGDRQANVDDMMLKNRHARLSGEKHGNAKLRDFQVKEILASSEPDKILAGIYGVHRSRIGQLRKKHAC